jgi:hypothetical protein
MVSCKDIYDLRELIKWNLTFIKGK